MVSSVGIGHVIIKERGVESTEVVPTDSALSMVSVSLSGSMVPSGLKTISRIFASFALTFVFVAMAEIWVLVMGSSGGELRCKDVLIERE